MEGIIINLFGDIPVVTRIWTVSCIGFSVLMKTGMVDPAKTLYNYELVFHKGQYERLLYSLFNNGELTWMTIMNIFVTANHLALLENTLPNKRQFLWITFLTLSMILAMSAYIQPVASIGSILHENLVYFIFKKRHNEINIPMFGGNEVATALLPFYMYFVMYFVMKRSVLEIFMNLLPGHIIYYMDHIITALYGVDLCKTPYDHWLKWKADRDIKNETNNGQNEPAQNQLHLD